VTDTPTLWPNAHCASSPWGCDNDSGHISARPNYCQHCGQPDIYPILVTPATHIHLCPRCIQQLVRGQLSLHSKTALQSARDCMAMLISGGPRGPWPHYQTSLVWEQPQTGAA